MTSKPVKLENVSKWYGKVIGLNEVTLEMGQGITGLLGPNGAGKSTMMKIITGQIKQDIGKVTVMGQRVWNNALALENVGYCPEGDNFYSFFTGRDFIELACRLKGVPDVKKETSRVLSIVEMEESADRKIRHYSKGMRQRIKFAQAIVGDPPLVILDEPLSGTDPVGRVAIINLIEKLGSQGRSMVVSSHVLHEIERMTDQIMLIHNGRLLAEGNIHGIRDMIDEHPHTVLIKTDEPRRLAKVLVVENFVESVRLDKEGVYVTTPVPQELYNGLPRVLVEEKFHVTHLSSPDDNLEAVFDYLVK